MVLYARPEADVVVVRVVGRGDLELSPQVKAVSDGFNRPDYSPRYIVDLEQCPSLDSTFMGALATVALHQTACQAGRMVVLNANATAESQMEKLGMKYLVDLRSECTHDAPAPAEGFQAPPVLEQSRFERIVHMIECHRALVDADSGNEAVFRPIIQSLSDSLAREATRRHNGPR